MTSLPMYISPCSSQSTPIPERSPITISDPNVAPRSMFTSSPTEAHILRAKKPRILRENFEYVLCGRQLRRCCIRNSPHDPTSTTHAITSRTKIWLLVHQAKRSRCLALRMKFCVLVGVAQSEPYASSRYRPIFFGTGYRLLSNAVPFTRSNHDEGLA